MLVLSVQRCQCKKDEPTPTPNPTPHQTTCDTCLPAITTNGQNTFGCRVNGKVWLPLDGSFSPGVFVDVNATHLAIEGYNSTLLENITIEVEPVTDTVYINFSTNNYFKTWGTYLNKDLSKYFTADTIRIGYIHFLRVDYTKGVFSGTFAFDAYNNKNDTVHITDGRFDIRK